jgi:hypothetical protein
MQRLNLSDQKPIPDWLDEVSDRFDIAIAQLAAMYDSLGVLNESSEEDYFSNAVFRVYVNKAEELNRVCAQLLAAKEHIQAIIRVNQDIYRHKKREFELSLQPLESNKQKLLEKLIEWKKQAPASHVASRRIPLIMDETLKSKTIPQLKALCALTEDIDLTKQAMNFEEEWCAYDARYNHFIAHGIEEVQVLSEKGLEALLNKADQLAREYMRVAQQLSAESHAVYDEIQTDNAIIRAEIQVAQSELRVALAAFRLEMAKHGDKYSLEICRDLVQKHAAMANLVEEGRCSLRILKEKTMVMKERYDTAYLKFGACPILKARKVLRQTDRFEQKLEHAEAVVEQSHKYIDVLKLQVLRGDLLNLLLRAIENNILFWHEQIDSFWGSSSKINGVSVPAGIALIYTELQKFDPEQHNATAVLEKIAQIASVRIRTGVGFFAKRTTTTQAFYKIIENNAHGLDALTEKKVQGVQVDLLAIRDSRKHSLQNIELKHDHDKKDLIIPAGFHAGL